MGMRRGRAGIVDFGCGFRAGIWGVVFGAWRLVLVRGVLVNRLLVYVTDTGCVLL